MNDFLRTLVPMLGTALGGPLGGAAASFIADKLGIKDATIEAVSEVLNSGKMSADQIASLKLAEIDFQKFLEGNKIELAKLDVEDRSSARDREIAVKDWIPGLLAILLTGGFFGVLAYMLQYGAPTHGGDALLVMLGSLGTGFASVLAYYFGSSAGSASKNEIIERLGTK
jgi:uncharacterized membrane protein YeaQ/YmgE (transglycosylase-associated protein family)